MKIVADENIPLVHAFCSSLGTVVTKPGRELNSEDVSDADILLVRSVTNVNAELLQHSRVQFVGSCTIGMDHLDREYLQSRNIAYANAPGCNANSVVEYVFSAISALGIDWPTKTVGIIGCGNVGGLLYRRLTTLGVVCYCYDPFLQNDDNLALTNLDTVLQCDIVSLHTPLTYTGPYPSYHLLGEKELAQLNPGCVLINAGRGAAIDNLALLEKLSVSEDLQVVLDVWESEPNINPDLLDKVVLGTPHIAGYSFDGKVRGTAQVFDALCNHLGVSAGRSNLLSNLLTSTESALQIDKKLPELSQISAAILQAYDIRDDDRQLRHMVSSVDNLEEGFDQLRNDYLIRHEFMHFTFEPSHLKVGAQKTLQCLGFKLS